MDTAIEEAVVECMFSKMGLIMTKKQFSLEDESLDMLMRIFLIFDKVLKILKCKNILCLQQSWIFLNISLTISIKKNYNDMLILI